MNYTAKTISDVL